MPDGPEPELLDRVANPHPGTTYLVRFTAPEFTSLCPVTGQPDFAHLVIDYVPDRWLIESKSLKLFLGAFRNHGHVVLATPAPVLVYPRSLSATVSVCQTTAPVFAVPQDRAALLKPGRHVFELVVSLGYKCTEHAATEYATHVVLTK
mgnify:CR=1 FL=1